MDIIQYSSQNKKSWDRFVEKSKNANFQHLRTYMEYHCDRFSDNSLLFIDNGNAKCLLPANRGNDTLYSHAGLSHGGLLLSARIKQKEVLSIFDVLLKYTQVEKIENIIIKLQPHIYNIYPSEEVHYALFRNNAFLSGRAVSSIICFKNILPYSKGRKWSLKKSLPNKFCIKESDDFESFMEIEKMVLKNKYNAAPVHTSSEIAYLKKIFPENIKLHSVNFENKMIGGVILFLMGPVVKCQYICSNALCKQLHGLDFLFDELLKKYDRQFGYFDFGHSTLQEGKYLENTLIQNKESYGARAVCYDTYTIKL